MIMTKKLMLFSAAVVACGSLFANGNQITWKGDGETPRWSDGSNWVGGVAPEKGDIAVIPEDTTAWASHYPASSDGDMTLINSLSGIRLAGTNAVLEVDAENDGTTGTGIFNITVPLSGNGRFVVQNTVNNDRYVTMTADNSAFTGVFVSSNAFLKVGNVKALGTSGNRVEVFGTYATHGLRITTPGVYSNDIHVIRSGGGIPGVYGVVKDGVPVVTNLGVIVNEANSASVYLGNIHANCVSNLYLNTSSIRISGTLEIGSGGYYGRSRVTDNAKVHFWGKSRGTTGYDPFGYLETGHAYITCHAPDVLGAVYLDKTTIDLGGYDQSTAVLVNLNAATLTTDRPATLTWVDSNTSGDQTMRNVEINGPVSIVYNMGTNGKKMTLGADGDPVSGTMSGVFSVKKSNVYFSPYINLPKLRKLVSTSKDKYNPSRVYVQTANLNPGRLRLAAAGEYGTIDVAEGLQLDVLNFLAGDAYVPEGVYGSAAAHEAHPELVDEDHVLACLTGTGTVKVRCYGEPGMMLILR